MLAENKWSQHRPLSFGRQTIVAKVCLSRLLSETVLKDDRWPVQASMELQDLEAVLPPTKCPLLNLAASRLP